jgi:predicted nucleic acid-binding protein
MIDTIVEAVIRESSRLKATYKMSLGDAIGLATTINLGGLFVTADDELTEPETREHAPILWFRPPKEKN